MYVYIRNKELSLEGLLADVTLHGVENDPSTTTCCVLSDIEMIESIITVVSLLLHKILKAFNDQLYQKP